MSEKYITEIEHKISDLGYEIAFRTDNKEYFAYVYGVLALLIGGSVPEEMLTLIPRYAPSYIKELTGVDVSDEDIATERTKLSSNER